jgi:signal transduction histidine kinase
MQVITNLVTNAINYTASGGTVRVVTSAHGNGEACVQVEDTGIGIASDHLPHIFQPFYRVGDKPGGTGLGLSISREIVEMHRGTIMVESEVGRGSRFTLLFALQPTASS